MKMLHSLSFLASTALVLPIAGAIAFAQPHPPGSPPLEQLNLTSEQKQKVQNIDQQSRTNAESQHKQLQEAEEQMRSLLGSDASADQLRQQHQKIQQLRQALDNQRFETMLAIREVLTPEQRTQMANMKPPRPEPPKGMEKQKGVQ